MKPLFKILLLAVLFLPQFLLAQNLTSFEPAAHFPLKNSAADLLGMNPEMLLINAPFAGNDGVYSNGNYIGTTADSCLVRTPHLAALYDSSFAVQLEFKLDSLDGKNRPVVVCGDGWRYLGFELRYDNKWLLLFNNATYAVPNLSAEAGKWYALTFIYSNADSTAHFYLDGTKIGERSGALERPADDGNLSNTNYGSGLTFKGHWRELKVFKSGQPFTAVSWAAFAARVKVFPNPTSWGVCIQVETHHANTGLNVRVYSADGLLVLHRAMDGRNCELQFPESLRTGVYQVVLDAPDGKFFTKSIVLQR
ncbi:MAG: hypothetical protein HY842_14290 [Bacteroidetes bacterium]|nr:hypothetical protein [Bacteroidota bacterium]